MFKKKDEEKPAPAGPPKDEHAYEDNWYRSLKALAAQSTDPDEATEVDEAPEPGPVSGSDAPADVATAEGDTGGEAPDAPVEGEEELETRANQLLERLRTLQHLGEDGDGAATSEDPSEEPSTSVWG
jgi:hypothetical protein